MICAASILFAAAVTTATNGVFFATPGWMPHAVDAAHGFGNGSTAARRVEPETLAGVNAMFEGWFERVYFGSQGATNDWDAAWWGGLGPRDFDFSIGAWHDPAFGWRAPGAAAPTTNRVVATRRWTEWRNARTLARTMVAGSGEFRFFVSRPEWLTNLWWATSAEMQGLSPDFLPQFSWTAAVTSAMRGGDCIPTLGQRGDCPVFGLEGEAETPAHFLMGAVIPSGTPQREAFDALAADDPHATEGLDATIRRAFPGVVSGGITNATRRLFPDAAGEIAAFEALMDRTVHSPEWIVTNVVTNVHHEATLTLSGSAEIRWEMPEPGAEPLPPVPVVTNVAWRAVETNRWSRGSLGPGPGEDVLALRFGGTSTELAKMRLADVEVPAIADTNVLAGVLTAAIGWLRDGDHLMHVDSVDLAFDGLGFFFEFAGNYLSGGSPRPFRQSFHLNVTNAAVATAGVTRRYDAARTVGGMVLGATQPGWEGSDRAGGGRVGALMGVLSARDKLYGTTQRVAWRDEDDCAETYATRVASFSSRAAAELLLCTTCRDAMEAKADALCGVPTDDPGRVIPVDASMAAPALAAGRWKAVIKNEDPYFAGGFYLGCTIAGGAITAAWLKLETWMDPMPLPQLCEIARIGFTNEGPDPVPEVEETRPFAADARFRAAVRTDWNWKTNRRTP